MPGKKTFFPYLKFVLTITIKVWPKYTIVLALKSFAEVLDVFLYSLGTAKFRVYRT